MTNLILLVMLAAVAAALVTYLQYIFRNIISDKTIYLLAALRFFSVFGLLLLLINPVVSSTSYEVEKPLLPIICDNSSSVAYLQATNTANTCFEQLITSKALQDKFDVLPHTFDTDCRLKSTLSFNGMHTRLDEVANHINKAYKNKSHPIILLTDGNQTSGTDFLYAFKDNNKVYPIILGDTTQFLDIKISRINVNRYAFLNNKFPAEVFLQYNGQKSVNANFTVQQGASVLAKQSINFSAQNRSQIIQVLLPASSTGVQLFKAVVNTNEKEKNLLNNQRQFAVEVIDQKTEIGIVTQVNHPDIAALKRAIVSNAQRNVRILTPNTADAAQFDVLILYQPNQSFRQILASAKSKQINTWIITGLDTDFSLLNQMQEQFDFKISTQKEDYLPIFSTDFSFFAAEDIGFGLCPPLEHPYGVITPKVPASTLLKAQIQNVAINQPLLAFTDEADRRNAFLFGEHIWKWRLQLHAEQQSFEKFDQLIDKIIQFLASNRKRNSLVVEAEPFYYLGESIEINAQYFNKNYEFDEKALLSISVTNKKSKAVKTFDMVRGGNNYKVNLSLPAGEYAYTVKEKNSNNTASGVFEIIDFDIEKQFVNPDTGKLKQLATRTKGSVYMPNQIQQLIDALLQDSTYKSTEKPVIKRSPLINWRTMLVLIAITLAGEWLIRKYRGML